jgi:NTE family protein
MKKALVVSVGGSKGSYAGGIVEYYLKKGKQYDNLYGSSIGSLVIPFAATGNYDKLKEAFFSITMDDIFSLNPFKIKRQQNGIFRYTINYWNVFKNIVINKNSSLGDTSKLRTHTIPKFFSQEDYNLLINSDKKLSLMVTNITTGEAEKKDLNEFGLEEWMDWMWASTCAPPFMSIATINEQHYIDGGVVIQVPIKQAIIDGCDEIDVILLSKKDNDWSIEHIRNSFHYQIKLLMLMMNKIKDHQIDLGYLSHHANKKIIVNFHYTHQRLTNNSLIFDKELSKKWWDMGYEYAENNQCESYIIDGNSYRKI